MQRITLNRIIESAHAGVPEYDVRPHPQGGFAISSRMPGSSVWLYGATHASETVLREALVKREDSLIRASFSAASASTAPKAKQLSLGLDIPSHHFTHAA